MIVTFKSKDGNSFVIDTDKFYVESMSVNEQSRYVVMNVFDEYAWKIQCAWVGEE